MRQFTCETYDKPWFHDRDTWPGYLAMLAENRFNRLHLAFGLGYDSLAHVRDPYFLFTYPYLLDVPGYDVGVTGLSGDERSRNLDTLKFIARETVRHGLDFQLGLWMHGYQWPAAAGVASITGLAPATHETYCRDALALLLKEVPEISAVGAARPWRKRHQGRQLRLLEIGVCRCGHGRPHRRDRPARQGYRR